MVVSNTRSPLEKYKQHTGTLESLKQQITTADAHQRNELLRKYIHAEQQATASQQKLESIKSALNEQEQLDYQQTLLQQQSITESVNAQHNLELVKLRTETLHGQESMNQNTQQHEQHARSSRLDKLGAIPAAIGGFGRGVVDDIKQGDWKSVAIKGIGLYAGYRAVKRVGGQIKQARDRLRGKGSTKKKSGGSNTRKRVLGGMAALFGLRYMGDIKDWLTALFGGDVDKRDSTFATIADKLGPDWTYDSTNNSFDYKGKNIPLTAIKDYIITTTDADGKSVIDIDATVAALHKYTQKNNIDPTAGNVADTTATATNYETVKEKEPELHQRYVNVGKQANKFYKQYQVKAGLGETSLESDTGFMVYHLDRNYDRIGHILQEKTFHTYMDASTTDMMETLFDYFPDTIIRYMRKYAPWMDKIQLDKLAADTSRLADWIDGMKPENKDKTKAMCIRMFEQWNAISLYTLAVRQSYSETVGDDPTRMGEFDGKKLKDLDLASITDPDLLAAVKKPRLDDDISQKIEQWNGDQQELLALWNAAETLEDRREIIQRLLNQIDSVGFQTRSAALSMIRGHLWETDAYIDYDIISQQYEEAMGTMRADLTTLLTKDPLTSTDLDTVRGHINDFYETMKLVAVQTEVRQETDKDGDLFARWDIPVVRAGKTMYHRTLTYAENGQWRHVAGVFAAADLATRPVRKVLAMRKLARLKKPRVLSPTVWTMKKIGKLALGPVWDRAATGASNTTRRITARPIRSLNRIKPYRNMRFSSPETLIQALQHNHITLRDAADLVSNKSQSKRRKRAKKSKARRQLGFSDDVAENMRLLVKETPLGQHVKGKKNLDLLIKHRDTPLVRRAMRDVYTGTQLKKMLQMLAAGTTTGRIKPLSKGMEKISSTVETLSDSISSSQKKTQKLTDKIFKKFDKELAKKAKKAGLTKGSPTYQQLAQQLRDSTDYQRNPLLQGALDKHNKLIQQSEQQLMKHFNSSSWKVKKELYANNDIIKRVVDTNGGLQHRKLPGRTGRMISVGAHALMLARVGSSTPASERDWGKTGMEAADFGLGMIPVAGGLYDIGMAFRGTDLNGRQMSTGERRVRGAVGLGTGILDVFSLGIGGTAIRASIKGGTKLVVKGAAKKIAAEGVELGTKGMLRGVAKQTLKSAGRDILIGTAAGVALIPVFDHFTQVPLDHTPTDEELQFVQSTDKKSEVSAAG